jgi:Ca2+-binding EF-hand superfamily protein
MFDFFDINKFGSVAIDEISAVKIFVPDITNDEIVDFFFTVDKSLNFKEFLDLFSNWLNG